jgi:hypothetical protein
VLKRNKPGQSLPSHQRTTEDKGEHVRSVIFTETPRTTLARCALLELYPDAYALVYYGTGTHMDNTQSLNNSTREVDHHSSLQF